MRLKTIARPMTTLVSLALAAMHFPGEVAAVPVNFSGTVTYDGDYSGDSLFVAVLDTTAVEDVTILDLQTFAVGTPPFSQPYSLDFDNAGLIAPVLVASFLDVDGGGVDSLSGGDIFGWYAGTATPMGISPAASQSGLDFALPRAEIHGDIDFAGGQTEARVDVSVDPSCILEGFRPKVSVTAEGPYEIIGLYAGTYCISAEGFDSTAQLHVCFGDPTCASPAPLTLSANGIHVGVDLNFAAVSPVEGMQWGRLKALYR